MYKKAPPTPKCGLVGSLTSHPVTAQSKIDTPVHSLPDKQQNVVADVVPPNIVRYEKMPADNSKSVYLGYRDDSSREKTLLKS